MKAAIDGGLAQNDRIFLVVTSIRSNSDNSINAGGKLVKLQILHGASSCEGLLRVPEYVGLGVHAHQEIGDVDAHSLLTHGGLVRVAGRL
jgi:hypothetical protein